MDTISAFAMGQLHRNDPVKVFDWMAAAQMIRNERPREVWAGLAEDWSWTAGRIYHNGEIILDDYTYLASTWATPQISLDGEMRDCYRMEADTPWDSGTKWPDEAKQVIANQGSRGLV